MRLAVHQERVDHRAEIVDERVADDLDHAGLRVDFNLRNVTAVGEGRGRTVADVLHVEAPRQAGGQFHPRVQLLGQFHEADASVGPGDPEPAGTKLDVGRRSFQYMRSDLATLFDDLFTRFDDRLAAR